MFGNFKESEAGATLVEYGVALVLAIVLGGTSLAALADNAEVNMDGACTSLEGSGTGLTYSCQ